MKTNNLKRIPMAVPGFNVEEEPYFEGLVSMAKEVTIPANTLLFQEHTPCENFMFLLEGTVRVFKHSEEGREITLYRVNPGELCLLSINSMVTGYTYPAAAKSETALRGLMIKAENFRDEMNNSELFRNFVLRNLVDRMTEVMSLVSDVAFRRLDLRLACFLGQQFERSGGQPLDFTHAALALELGTSREVISRILKEFERQKCIQLSRGRIHLVSPEGLEWFAEEG